MEYEFIRIEYDGSLKDLLSKLEPLRDGKWEYVASYKEPKQAGVIIFKRKK